MDSLRSTIAKRGQWPELLSASGKEMESGIEENAYAKERERGTAIPLPKVLTKGGRDLASEHAKVHEAIGVSAVKETENTEIARGVTHDPQTGTKTHYRKSYLNSHSTI
jgi:hypothetical protein